MIVVYVIGLPAGIFAILHKHRKTLFGPDSAETMRAYGFLYDSYGPSAWFWETEELLRKLFLTAVAVLMDSGSPLQVNLRPPVSVSLSLSCISTSSPVSNDRVAL